MTVVAGRRRGGQNAGFSLIEMLVVLMVIGLLFSVAIPSYRTLTRPTPMSIARSVMQAAQLTRLSALKSGVARNLIIDTKARFVLSEVGKKPIEIPPQISLSATIGATEGARVEQGSITFHANGGATGGVIRVSSERGPIALVRVNWLTGIATLSQETGNGFP